MKYFRLINDGSYDDGLTVGPSFTTRELAEAHLEQLQKDSSDWDIEEFDVLDELPTKFSTYFLQIAVNTVGEESFRRLTTTEQWSYNAGGIPTAATNISVGSDKAYITGWHFSESQAEELVDDQRLKAIDMLNKTIHERATKKAGLAKW